MLLLRTEIGVFTMKKNFYRILAVSDTEVLKRFTVYQIKERFKDINFIMSAGDLSNEYLDYLVSILDKDLIYINGNHVYSKNHDISFCKEIDGKVIKYKGLKILGLDGSKLYSYEEHQYSEIQMAFRIIKNWYKLIFGKLDIVLTHSPPFGIHDKEDPIHTGFKSFVKIIDVLKPKLWIHGHIHLSNHIEKQESMVGNTKVINAYGYKIIELEINK